MANLCIKTPSSAILVLIFQLFVLRPRPNGQIVVGVVVPVELRWETVLNIKQLIGSG